MNTDENKTGANLRPGDYWRLWLFDTVLVTAGLLFFLATFHGTYEFFGTALRMALLPLIPLLVLVGGAGSTVFALTKVLVERRGLKKPAALALLAGPALAVTLLLVLLGAVIMPAHRLSYICIGNAPAAASHVRVAGYSVFLRSEWLAVFDTDEAGFQSFVSGAKLEPVPSLEFSRILERSSLKETRAFQNLPQAGDFKCFRRIFQEREEHKRGDVYAAFDPTTTTAVVFREYHD